MNIVEIGTQIRDARVRSKLTQRELATQLKMSRSTISALETGDVFEIGIQKVLRICMVLNLELTVMPREKATWESVARERDAAMAKAMDESSKILRSAQA